MVTYVSYIFLEYIYFNSCVQGFNTCMSKLVLLKGKKKYIDDEKINHELTPIIAIHKKLVFFP